jgi:hypothetical protein
MMSLRSAAAGLLAVSFGATLSAQSFSYADFSSTGSLSLLGTAAQSGTALRLTANASNQTGWAWHQTALPVLAGFDTTFTFRITPPTVGTKAEGMALVIHDDPNGLATTGGTVWGMGYGTGANSATGIRNSIAIELDTYNDGFLSDTSANELTIHTRGAQGNHEHEQYSIARTTPAQNLSNGQIHTLRVRYVPGTIEVFVDGSPTAAITRAYSLTTGGLYANNSVAPAPTLANGTALVGFCATTGAGTLTELVEILSWNWTSTPLKDPCYAGSFGEDVLTIDGSAGDAFREVHLATYQPFTIDMAAATAAGPGVPYVLVLSLLPQPGALGTALGFGNTCMPVLPLGPTELYFADSWGLFPGLLPAGLAPFAFPLPAGVVTFPLDFTLQAVTVASVNPIELGVSNALDVKIQPSPAPVITVVAPASAAVGQPVTLTGMRFVPGFLLEVNGTPVVPTSSSATQIVFPYPAGLTCDSQVSVTNPDGQVATAVINPTPVITSTVLGSGTAAGNQIFLVQGSGFAAGSTMTIGGAPALTISATGAAMTVRTPPGTPGTATVVVTTPGGCTASTTYTYL